MEEIVEQPLWNQVAGRQKWQQ